MTRFADRYFEDTCYQLGLDDYAPEEDEADEATAHKAPAEPFSITTKLTNQ